MLAAVLVLLFLVAPVGAEAQEPGRIPRVGILHTIPPAATFQAFKKGLQELGYTEGQNIHLAYRGTDGDPEGLPALAGRMGESRFDVIVAISSGAARAATKARASSPSFSVQWEKIPFEPGWSRAWLDREATPPA